MANKNPTSCDATGSLVKAALHLVNTEPRGLVAVHQKTGVPFYWLQKFSAGKIAKPNANRIQVLIEKLTGSKIKTNVSK